MVTCTGQLFSSFPKITDKQELPEPLPSSKLYRWKCLWGDEHVYYLDCGNGSAGIYVG